VGSLARLHESCIPDLPGAFAPDGCEQHLGFTSQDHYLQHIVASTHQQPVHSDKSLAFEGAEILAK